jgi:outer membrane protein assembly factor BamB
MFRFRTNPGFRAPLTAGGSSTSGYLLAAGVGLVVALFVLMAFSASRGGADELFEFYLLPGDPPPDPSDALYPEGIAANESGTFYVSSFSDGSIYRGDVREEDVKPFLAGGQDGRTQAIGLKLDDEGRLYIAGGFTGKVFIYDTASKKLVRSSDAPGAGFLNDLAINPQTGDTYITDSFVPILWRISGGQLEPWLDLDDPPNQSDPIPYTPGQFNLNGIVATPDGRYLLAVQAFTGKLYRIDTRTKQVREIEIDLIDLGSETLKDGDGLVLTNNTLYVINNKGYVTKIALKNNFNSGEVEGNTSVPVPPPKDGAPPEEDGDFPTTGALVGGRLLVVNSQFDEGGPVGGADPEIPFTVSAISPAP